MKLQGIKMLGETLRKIRKEKKMTIKDVAERGKITKSLISKIENNKASPSMNTLKILSNIFSVPIGMFFETDNHYTDPVTRKEDRKILHTQNGITYYLLSPDLKKNQMEFVYIEYEPGSSTKVSFSHKGEECGIVLQGCLEITYGEKKIILREGDSVYLDSTIPHQCTNISDGVTITVWIDTPPSW